MQTQEDQLLEAMRDVPGFQHQWRVEVANDRCWLIHPVCKIFRPGKQQPTLEQVLLIEQAVRTMNQRGWRLCDPIVVAIDPVSQQPFILDCSNAGQFEDAPRENEAYRIEQWMKEVGYEDLAELRRQGRSVTTDRLWVLYFNKNYSHVYRFKNPDDVNWDNWDLPLLEDAIAICAKQQIWVATEEPLT